MIVFTNQRIFIKLSVAEHERNPPTHFKIIHNSTSPLYKPPNPAIYSHLLYSNMEENTLIYIHACNEKSNTSLKVLQSYLSDFLSSTNCFVFSHWETQQVETWQFVPPKTKKEHIGNIYMTCLPPPWDCVHKAEMKWWIDIVSSLDWSSHGNQSIWPNIFCLLPVRSQDFNLSTDIDIAIMFRAYLELRRIIHEMRLCNS